MISQYVEMLYTKITKAYQGGKREGHPWTYHQMPEFGKKFCRRFAEVWFSTKHESNTSKVFDSRSQFGGGAYQVEYWEQTRVWGPVSVLSCFFQL